MTDIVAGDDATCLVSRLFERHHVEIFGYLARMVDDRELAQDLAQETFLQAHRMRASLRGIVEPRAWLYRVSTNLALNAIKRRRRFAWLPWSTSAPAAPDSSGQVGERSAVEVALTALPPPYRAPLLLYSHYGLSMAEVARALGINDGAAKTRIYRAREMFRQAYERESKG